MPQVREFKIPRRPQRWKRRLEVYSPSFILYRDYSNRLTNFVKVGELSWGWSRAVTPHRKEMLRRTFIKESDAWANSGLVFISSVLFTPLGEMISLMKYPLYPFLSTVFCVLGLIFTWVSCSTPKFGAHNRKMSLRKFPRETKKG